MSTAISANDGQEPTLDGASPGSSASEKTTKTPIPARRSPEDLLSQTMILSLLSRSLSPDSIRALSQASPTFCREGHLYLPSIDARIGDRMDFYHRLTGARPRRLVSSVTVKASDTASDDAVRATSAWLKSHRVLMRRDCEIVVEETGQDARPILDLLSISYSSRDRRIMHVQCRDGDVENAFGRTSTAWAWKIDDPASNRSSMPNLIIYEGCLSENGKPIDRSSEPPSRNPVPMSLTNTELRLRPNQEGRLFEPHSGPSDLRWGRLPMLSALLSPVARDLLLNNDPSFVITAVGPSNVEESRNMLDDLKLLWKAFTRQCEATLSQEAVDAFNAEIRRPWLADRKIRPSTSIEDYRSRLLKAISFQRPS